MAEAFTGDQLRSMRATLLRGAPKSASRRAQRKSAEAEKAERIKAARKRGFSSAAQFQTFAEEEAGRELSGGVSTALPTIKSQDKKAPGGSLARRLREARKRGFRQLSE